jgi:NADPH:quinone reductase-like Zn-dependent oxidoreductase
MMIAGNYGYRPQLPAIMGTEGAGRVVAVRACVKHLKEGDRTLMTFPQPAWAERIKTNTPWLRPLPPGDIQQFAMMDVNPPTAYLLLTDIVKLPRGAWVIKNGANSGVGRATIAIAKSLGLRTVNVVRRGEVIAEVRALGGDVVLLDGPDLAKCVEAEIGNASISLALDGVSDTSPMNLMSRLAESGVLVSYGGRKPMFVHPGNLIFKKLTIISGSHAGSDYRDVRSFGAPDRRRHDLGSGHRHLWFRPIQGSHRQRGTEPWQGAVHAKSVIRLHVRLTRSHEGGIHGQA